MFDSLWLHGRQHTRLPCPSVSPGVFLSSCPLSRGCYLTISFPSWITALSWQWGLHSSMKLWAIPCRATQDGGVMVESSDKIWSTGGGNTTIAVFLPQEPHEQYKRKKGRLYWLINQNLECTTSNLWVK